ncbi:MAG TPA: hypothetical protein VFK20_07720 [Vicinamibacterales bacterium]|nr:hypothetical protein [Vicinamibacterales bacterium]
MQRTVIVLAAAALIGGASAAAQSNAAMGKDMKRETYTGCLKASPNGTFQLTGVAMADSSMKKHAGAMSAMKTDAMKTDAITAPTLTLSSTSVDLAAHVGHKVSVTGSPAQAMSGMKMDDATMENDDMKVDVMGKDDMTSPPFNVTSLKVVSGSCS